MQNIIFFGSDQYSAVALNAIILPGDSRQATQNISVITDRPKPVGKDQFIGPNPVEKLAITHNLKVSYYPTNQDGMSKLCLQLTAYSQQQKIIGLCASFDHLLPKEIIKIFAGNLYNLHPSLLPQYRNVSPVQYAIALGDKVTGITLFRITTGIDNGEIISQISESILPEDTTPVLTSRLFTLGADLFLRSDLPRGKEGLVGHPTRSDLESAPLVFTHRLTRDSGYIEWPVLSKLLDNKPITLSESKNELLNLRLQKEKIIPLNLESRIYLLDLHRALTPWPSVWTIVPSKKGELRVTLESVIPETKLKIAGKPKSISYLDFAKYYL